MVGGALVLVAGAGGVPGTAGSAATLTAIGGGGEGEAGTVTVGAGGGGLATFCKSHQRTLTLRPSGTGLFPGLTALQECDGGQRERTFGLAMTCRSLL